MFEVERQDKLNKTLTLAKALIEKPSITPNDQGCQLILAEQLKSMNFDVQHLKFGAVDNFFARYGKADPLIVFAGHTDVVPPGPLSEWTTPPFTPTLREGYLFGRGAADMKGSLAAMITACERFISQHPTFKGSIGFLVTSDEEGPALDGTQKVVQWLKEQNIHMHYCIVGEPSSENTLGDTIKVGRRGSLSGYLKIFGEQGHIAYAEHQKNPIHLSLASLHALANLPWEPELHPFPKTSFHIANLHAGTQAANVIPGILECQFNFRFSPAFQPEQIQTRVRETLDSFNCAYELNWVLSGLPFLTNEGKLRQVSAESIQEILKLTPEFSTSGGTSDARFIATLGAEVIELGPCRKTIHAINECVKAQDLETLSFVYERILEQLLT